MNGLSGINEECMSKHLNVFSSATMVVGKGT
jgi:hypothetical protein